MFAYWKSFNFDLMQLLSNLLYGRNKLWEIPQSSLESLISFSTITNEAFDMFATNGSNSSENLQSLKRYV